jgi:hypothetical protein
MYFFVQHFSQEIRLFYFFYLLYVHLYFFALKELALVQREQTRPQFFPRRPEEGVMAIARE